jgi:DNA-binding PadR family transcriptional regulator
MDEQKEVTNSVESYEIDVLKSISNYLTISQISKSRKVSRAAIYKVIGRISKKGYIRKIGHIYEVTEQGVHYLNESSPNLLRLHNLAFKIKILYKPNNWDLMRSKIVTLKTYSKEVKLNNNEYQIYNFSNIKIKTTKDNIIFYMPTFYGKNTDEAFSYALKSLFDSIPKIENIFRIILIKDKKANIEIISNHYSKLQDSLAKLYKIEENKLYVSDSNGELWLIADFSFKVNELETIHTKTAKEDMDSVKAFLNDLRSNPTTFTNVLELVKQVTANQIVFDKNMQSHISAIQTLGKEVKRLNKTLGGIITENKKLKLGDQKTLGKWI